MKRAAPMPRPISVRHHAVDRVIERWWTAVQPPMARRLLEVSLPYAEHVEDVPDERQSIWSLPDLSDRTRVMLIVVDHHGEVRTVLPPSAQPRTNRRCGSQGVDDEGHCKRCGLVPDGASVECPPGFLP